MASPKRHISWLAGKILKYRKKLRQTDTSTWAGKIKKRFYSAMNRILSAMLSIWKKIKAIYDFTKSKIDSLRKQQDIAKEAIDELKETKKELEKKKALLKAKGIATPSKLKSIETKIKLCEKNITKNADIIKKADKLIDKYKNSSNKDIQRKVEQIFRYRAKAIKLVKQYKASLKDYRKAIKKV